MTVDYSQTSDAYIGDWAEWAEREPAVRPKVMRTLTPDQVATYRLAVTNLSRVADELAAVHERARMLLVDTYLDYLASDFPAQARERRAVVGDLVWVLTGRMRAGLDS